MKKLIQILPFLFSLALFGQSPNTPPITFASRFQITNVVNGTLDTLVISGYVDDCSGRFTNSDITIGDSLYVLEGSDLLIFGVVSTRTISLGIATFKVKDFNGAGLNPSNGQAAIFETTTNLKLPSYVCGLRDDLQQFIMNRQAQLLDNAGQPTYNVNATSHGYTSADVGKLVYLTGSNVVKLASADFGEADSVAQWAIAEIVDANNMKLCNNCLVTLPSAHGITPNSYIWLSETPGGFADSIPETGRNTQLVGKVTSSTGVYFQIGDVTGAGGAGIDTAYIRNDSVFVVSGGMHIFTGSFTDNSKILNWVARQKLEPQLNPPVSLTVGDTVFSRLLDAKYLYVPNSQEQRIYFVSTVNGSTVRGYRYVSSYDFGRTWSWANTQPAYFTPIGWGHEVNLHEHFILAEDSLNWKMWYQAVDSLNIYRTRFATSNDAGKTWTRQGTCLDVGGIGEWDNTYAGVRNVLKLDDGTYYMCYEGKDATHNMSAGIATSTDGLNWTKNGQVLVMDTAIYSWESNGMIPYVQKINGKYLMLYGNNNQNTLLNDDQYIGMAYSDDGINFTKYENNPILNLDTFFDPESGWNYFEEFISFEPVPGQEGAFSVITRGRKEFGAIWNFGLYWLGNRVQVPKSTGNQWYVNTVGKNYSALKGGIFNAASSPFYVATTTGKAATGNIINVLSGTYTAGVTPTFSSNYIQHSLARRDSVVVNCDRGVVFYANLPTSTLCFASDANASVSSDSSRFFTVRGKPTFKINRTSTSGTNLGIGFYNIASNIDLSLRRIENLGGGRNWGLQVGCGTAKIDCDEIEVSGGVVASIGNASSSGAVISTYNKRNINIKVGVSISNGVSDSFGAYRYQCSQTKDSMSLITFEIGRAILQGTRHSLLTLRTTGFKSSLLDCNFGNVVQKTSASKINGYSTSGTAEILFDSKPTFSGGNVNINIKNIETPNPVFLSSDTSNYTLDSTIVHLKIDKGKFTSSSPFVLSGITLRNNSKLIIECEHCVCTGNQSAFWVFGNTIDASSSIEIKGNYIVSGANAVLNTRSNVVLENTTLINNGSVAAIQSDTATSIVVKSAYANSTVTDADITELVSATTRNTNVK